MKIEQWKTEDIIPYENNPRINDQAVDKVATSLEQYGWQQPIVVDKSGVVIAGHTRLKAAIKLCMETCPVVVAENLTKAQAKAYRIADNRTGEFAEWDKSLLDIEIHELIDMDFDIELTGFSLEDFCVFNPEGGEMPEMPNGDKAPIQQLTFTLHDDQAEIVKAAIQKAKDAGPFVDTGNENSNGNALARIAEAYCG